MSLKSVAVIPVHNRHSLLRVTIKRLYEKNGVDHVICIGESSNRDVCQNAGAEFVEHPNLPLGRKWNAGFRIARQYRPDCVVYVGSSDWLSDNWLSVLYPLSQRYDIVGKFDFNMLHVGESLKVGYWPRYAVGTGRENELIGIGRLISREFLDKIAWEPFDDELNKSMDWCMWRKVAEIGGIAHAYNIHEVQSLAVSCDKWSNMHSSDFNNPNVIHLRDPEAWLKIWFPEALKLEL